MQKLSAAAPETDQSPEEDKAAGDAGDSGSPTSILRRRNKQGLNREESREGRRVRFSEPEAIREKREQGKWQLKMS